MGRVYNTKEEYIAMLKACEQAREDFADLKYCRNARGEYMVLKNVIGNVYMFEITGYTEAQIKHTLALVECGIKPNNFIEDNKKRMEVGRLCG